MKEKVVFALDIGSGSIKLMAGYELDGKPFALNVLTYQMPGLMREGVISDVGLLSDAVKRLVHQMEENIGLKVNKLIASLPPVNLQIYEATKTMNVLSPQGRVAIADISNLHSLFRKETIGEQYHQLGIVPIVFVIDNKREFEVLPLGETSNNIQLTANIHFIDGHLFESFQQLSKRVGIPIRKVVVDSHAIGELLPRYMPMPDEYILIDMGDRLTTISFIAMNRLYYSYAFDLGGHHLTEMISVEYDIDYQKAKNIKEKYGYQTHENYFDGVIHKDTTKQNSTFRQSQLNVTIERFYEQFQEEFNRHYESLIEEIGEGVPFNQLPFYVVGGAGKLKGLHYLLSNLMSNHQITCVRLPSFGARSMELITPLSLIKTASKYTPNSSEDKPLVTPIEREKTKPKQSVFNAYEDEL
jgi:cell division protein FtsA